MLEQMRKSSQSLLIYLLFGIVIVVFIVNFGPQSQGGCQAQTDDRHYAAKVAGDSISTADFRYGFLLFGGGQYPAQIAKRQRLKESVLDKLIERELLAQEAERLGFAVSDKEVEDLISESKMIGLGYPRMLARVQKDGAFSYEAFKNFVQFELGLAPNAFIEEQKRELMASHVRDLLRSSVSVSENEIKAEFERRERQVNLEHVRFSARRYEAAVAPTPAEVADYAKANEAKLKELYEQRKFLYQKAPKEIRVRQIVVKAAGEDEKALGAAQKKIEALAARVQKGEAFEKVAKEASEDEATKARGGDLGWKRSGSTGLDQDTETKLFAAKPGEVVGPVKSGTTWVLLAVEKAREGDIPFDQVKLELAEEKLRDERAKAKAKAEAEAALAKAKSASDQTLKQLFPAKPEGEAAEAADKAKATKTAAKADKGAAAEEGPSAEETGLFSRRTGHDANVVEGIGASPELAKAAFTLTPESPLAGPFEVGDSFVVVRLKERKEPDMATFEKKKAELLRDAELTKWIEVLTDWTHRRCVEAREANKIEVNAEVLKYEDNAEPVPYEPCMTLKPTGT